MSNQANDELLERAYEAQESGIDDETSEIIATLVQNNDLEGLAWVLEHLPKE
jgi:hypothetical protein